ncbi:hypothetical protein ACERII_17985 [Evansella sp. AB-rgal1]|uniref:hypothetical protein n=1 Tax=Evansella sp. AB-rgal1 TaxID=3242696 RepID=UPI00359E612C
MLNKVMAFILILALSGCSLLPKETMDLLDEEISSVSISKTMELGEINESILHVFTDDETIPIFREAITTATKETYSIDIDTSDYDLLIEYESDEGALPAHPIHLWLGEEGEHSYFMYMIDTETLCKTSNNMTNSLRLLLHSINQ